MVLVVCWTMAPLGAGTGEDGMAVFAMSDKENTCIKVRVGQTFQLRFLTSPGTGYGWELAAPLNQDMLAIMETKMEPSASGLLGASEYEIWTCRAQAIGRAEIKLQYVRPWEKDTEPLKKHVFKVLIQ